MPEEISGAGAVADASVSTEPRLAGPTLEEERQNALTSAAKAVEKAEAHLKAAKDHLAALKKGMN